MISDGDEAGYCSLMAVLRTLMSETDGVLIVYYFDVLFDGSGHSLLLRFLFEILWTLRCCSLRCERESRKPVAFPSMGESSALSLLISVVIGEREAGREAIISRRMRARSLARRERSMAVSISWRRKRKAVLRCVGSVSATEVSPAR